MVKNKRGEHAFKKFKRMSTLDNCGVKAQDKVTNLIETEPAYLENDTTLLEFKCIKRYIKEF